MRRRDLARTQASHSASLLNGVDEGARGKGGARGLDHLLHPGLQHGDVPLCDVAEADVAVEEHEREVSRQRLHPRCMAECVRGRKVGARRFGG